MGLNRNDPSESGAVTDGCICNHEVRVVDPVSGKPVAAGEEGEILTRGPEVMLGYTKQDYTDEAFDEDGFFRSGDLGFISDGTYISVT